MNTIKILDSNVSIIIYVYNIYLDVFLSSSVSTKQFFNLVRYKKIALDFFKEAKEESMRKRGKKKVTARACLVFIYKYFFYVFVLLSFPGKFMLISLSVLTKISSRNFLEDLGLVCLRLFWLFYPFSFEIGKMSWPF